MLQMTNSVKKLDSRGMTLVETLMGVVISYLLITGIYVIALAADNMWQVVKTKTELQQELRKGMAWMISELRQAGSLSIVDVPANSSWYSAITFQIPSGVTAGALTWNPSTIQFIKGGTHSDQLLRISGGATGILGQDLLSIQFRRQTATPNILEVAMQARKNTDKGRQINYQLSFSVELRN